MKRSEQPVRWRYVVVLALALAGCSSVPLIVPDMAHTRAPIRVESSNGRMLSAAQSKSLLDKLKASGNASGIFERHLAVEEQIAGSPLTTGNAVTLLQDGPATYAAMFAAIAAARDHINMETYIFDDDATGRQFADALIAKQQQGVQVNLIHDGVGTLTTPAAFFQRMRDAGIGVVEFNPINPLTAKAGWDVNARDHRKLLIVDGETAFLGGVNISGVYSGGSSRPRSAAPRARDLPWRDTHLQVSGPVVAELQKFFMQTWERQQGAPRVGRNYFAPLPARGKQVVRAIASSPEEPFSPFYGTFMSAINSAESEIMVTNAYFVPDPQLMEALIAAVARGVKVELILPSATDSSLVFHAGRAHYARLLRGGVKLYERESVLLHSKTALIDGVWSTVGSTNLDWRSFLHNQELNVVVLGAEFGERMRAAFERDRSASTLITPEAWEHRPLANRFKELFGRIWEYWL